MKKLLLTTLLFAFAMVGFAQTTYYWVGGANGNMGTSSNWNANLAGGGATSAPNANDVFIFDGTNIGGTSTPVTGKVTPNITTSFSFGQLKFQNGADVVFMRSPSSLTAGSGTSTITVNGDGTIAPDLTIEALSSLKLTTPVGYTNAQATALILGTASVPSTGTIDGTLSIIDAGQAKVYVSVFSANSLNFKNGSKCYVNNTFLNSNPLSPSGGATINNGIVFELGSSLIYQGGNSPYTTTSVAIPMIFNTGSNLIVESLIVASNLFKGHYLANVTIRNNTTANVDAVPYNVDDLTIENGSSLTLTTSGVFPVSGNIVNNGTIGSAASFTTSTLLFKKNGTQSISGNGSFNPIGALIVGTDAKLTTNQNINVSGTSVSSITGLLNLGSSIINGSGDFQLRGTSSVAGTAATITSGDNSIVLDPTKYIGGATPINTANVAVGLLITGNGIPANTYIIGSNSATSTITISNPATASSLALSGSVTISGTAPTLQVSNTGGVDASISSTGTRSLGSGTNLILDAPTSSPFPTFSTNNFGNVTFNAASTTNTDATITGALTLNNAKLTVRPGDNLTMSATSSFAGASSSAYVFTDANASTGAIGILKLEGVVASKSIPVGSATNYLPVTLNPSVASDFSINVFTGVTADATPNGTALTAGQKLDAVDVIYNIVRTSGSGSCDVTLGWDVSLEGTNFNGFANNQIGVAQYTGSSYTTFSPSTADNTANTAMISTTAFAPFLIGKAGATLPVNLISFTAKASNQTAVLNWQTTSEVNLSHYLVQRSADGKSFETLTSVNANNTAGVFNYSFTDNAPAFGANYYQLVSVDIDGKTSISNLQSVNFGAVANLSVYPNPTKNALNINGLVKGDIVRVTDLVGKTLSSVAYSGDGAMSLNLASNNVGIYLLTVSNNGKVTSTHRIIRN